MKRAKKTRVITYRLDDEIFQLLEQAAQSAGEHPNDWCRKLTIAELSKGHGLTTNERIIFEELSRVRYLLGHGFRLLATDKLTAQEWENVKTCSDEKPAEITSILLARHRPSRPAGGA